MYDNIDHAGTGQSSTSRPAHGTHNMIKRCLSNKFLCFAGLLLIVIAGYRLSTCHSRKIKAVIREIQHHVRTEDVDGCLEYVADDYFDAYGYRRADIRSILSDAFQSLDAIQVIVLDRTVSRTGDEAVVHVVFRVVATVEAGFRGYIIGNMNQPAEVTVYMRYSEKKWRIRRIDQISTIRRKSSGDPADSSHVWNQHIGHGDGSIRFLVVFQNGNQCSGQRKT
jgi:ketosteroid isomerase-like protein